MGYSFSVSRGVVAAIRELEFGDGKPMVQVAVPIEPGSSGSPVINLDGEVVAILSIKSGGAMGFGVPINALRNLMEENSKEIPIQKWLTIGTLDKLQWKAMMGGSLETKGRRNKSSWIRKRFWRTDVVLKSIREASSSFRDRSGSQTGERQWCGWSSFLLG